VGEVSPIQNTFRPFLKFKVIVVATPLEITMVNNIVGLGDMAMEHFSHVHQIEHLEKTFPKFINVINHIFNEE
jgi:hypothetical protein